jgi:hypothetical protein
VASGNRHTRSLHHDLFGRPVRRQAPGWQVRPATRAFNAQNAAAQPGTAFQAATCVRSAGTSPVVIRDAAAAAGNLAGLADHHQHEAARPWGRHRGRPPARAGAGPREDRSVVTACRAD